MITCQLSVDLRDNGVTISGDRNQSIYCAMLSAGIVLNVDVLQVKNLSEWKSQLAEKNSNLKEENKRFVCLYVKLSSSSPTLSFLDYKLK